MHKLIAHDLRLAYTVDNRDTCLAIFDALNRNRLQRKNVSTDALRGLRFANDGDTREKTMTLGEETDKSRTASSGDEDMLQRCVVHFYANEVRAD